MFKILVIFLLVIEAEVLCKSATLKDDYTLQRVTEPVDHSEGPTWDGRKNILYFVDIPNKKLFSYTPSTGVTNSITLNDEVALAIPSKNNPNLIFAGVGRSLVAVEWDGGRLQGTLKQKTLTNVAQQFPQSRFNDGKADKEGRLWLGTMGTGDQPGQGILYKITKQNYEHPEVEIAPVGTSNGMAWNKANNKYYYIDTPSMKVVEYNYDNNLGTISSPRTVIDISQQGIPGAPDGMTIDENDNLWVALWGGGAVLQVDSKSGKILQTIKMPATYVTSAMWGGPLLDTLYVTTSRTSLDDDERKKEPEAGAVFAVTNLGTKGLPVFGADIVDQI